jgi:aryl-alcohol dehydrogenase (NADP+)
MSPTLPFPVAMNRQVQRMLQYAGATVDGQESAVYPPLLASTTRY